MVTALFISLFNNTKVRSLIRDYITYILNGTLYKRDGTLYKYDGTLYKCDGTLYKYDGTLYIYDGTLYKCDGTLYICDGTLYKCDGTKIFLYREYYIIKLLQIITLTFFNYSIKLGLLDVCLDI